jgi:phosphatidate phosphatase
MFTVYPTRIFLDFSLLFLVWLPVILFATVVKPFERGYYCDDESIRYPYRDSTVPNYSLYILGAALPIITIVFIETFRVLKFDPRQIYKIEALAPAHQLGGRPIPPLASNLYIYLGYFMFGAALCQGVTDLGKYCVGRLRPHFYDVCKPAVDCTKLPPYTYVEFPNCTTTDHETLREARLSFPSGHASFGAYTMFFLVLYIQARLIWPMVSLLVKHVLQNVCVVLGVACALSRVSDYKHHWSDVLSGVILGVTVACLTAFHMVGLFRHPHRVFSNPPYMVPLTAVSSFGGDHFHNDIELQFFREQLYSRSAALKEQNINFNSKEQGAPMITTGMLNHRDGNIVE